MQLLLCYCSQCLPLCPRVLPLILWWCFSLTVSEVSMATVGLVWWLSFVVWLSWLLAWKETSCPVYHLCFLHTGTSHLSCEPWWSDFACSCDGCILLRKSWLCSFTPTTSWQCNSTVWPICFLSNSKLLDVVILWCDCLLFHNNLSSSHICLLRWSQTPATFYLIFFFPPELVIIRLHSNSILK